MASSDLKETLDQLRLDSNISVRERLFFEAAILDACGMRETAIAATPPDFLEAVRSGNIEGFIAKAGVGAKSDRQRLALQLNLRTRLAYLCRNFGAAIPDADVDRAYVAAATAGNPTAQARVIDKRLADSAVQNHSKLPGYIRDNLPKPAGFPDPMTAAEQSQLLGALFSEDPIAIRHAGAVMSTGGESQSLRIGPASIDVGQHAEETWTLVACKFGFECGDMNSSVNFACAQLSQCTSDYEELLREYVLTPDEFNRISQNAQLIADAIRRRDLSAFRWVNAPGQVRTVLAVPGMVRIH